MKKIFIFIFIICIFSGCTQLEEPKSKIPPAPAQQLPDIDAKDKAAEPKLNEPETNEPETNEPETNEPETNEPETNEPEINEPEQPEPEELQLKQEEIKPEVQEPAQIEPAPSEKSPASGDEVAYYATPLLDKNKGRLINIQISSKAINGKILKPGEIFSFNDTVGKRTSQKGYEEAIIFKNMEQVKALGGGICQLSSTLYNAALDAGFEIVERHPHQLKVTYVAKDRDATVSYGNKDFKFKNNQEYSIVISTKITNDEVIVAINII